MSTMQVDRIIELVRNCAADYDRLHPTLPRVIHHPNLRPIGLSFGHHSARKDN